MDESGISYSLMFVFEFVIGISANLLQDDIRDSVAFDDEGTANDGRIVCSLSISGQNKR